MVASIILLISDLAGLDELVKATVDNLPVDAQLISQLLTALGHLGVEGLQNPGVNVLVLAHGMFYHQGDTA
jgi:hypothetical protein